MSPAAPDHTDTDSSMMLAAAKPATPRRLRKSRSAARGLVGGVLGELGGGEAGAGERLDQVGRIDASGLVHRRDALADRLARAPATPGTAASAASTLRMQPPQCMFSTASVVVVARAHGVRPRTCTFAKGAIQGMGSDPIVAVLRA